jgi:hypothetical protein
MLGPINGFKPGNAEMQSLRQELRQCSNEILMYNGKITTATPPQVFKNTRPKILSRYRNAYRSIREGRVFLDNINSNLKTFVKYEKIPIGKINSGKPPRLIQHRSYEYLYALKSCLLNYDLLLKNNKDQVMFNNQAVGDIFTKMHDQYGIASALRRSWDSFKNPVAICLDHSKFDGHYHEELLKLEHEYWHQLSASKLLTRLLRMQLRQKGVTKKGIRYKVKGTRASGEYTTSSGNSVLNYCMLACYLKASGITNFKIAVNGDDSVLFFEASELNKLKPLSYFNNFNMETECDRIVHDFCEITYCQTSPVRVLRDQRLQWYMCKTPARAISRICFAPYQYKQALGRYRAGIGLCELASNRGVPILQSIALSMLSMSDLVRPLACVDRYPAAMSGNDVGVSDIPLQTRLDFQTAFNINVTEQLRIERELAGRLKKSPLLKPYIARYKNFVNLRSYA